MVVHLPLDIEYWFISVFSGSFEMFTLVALFTITCMAAYFKMSSITYGMFIAMFAVILATNGFNNLLILLILIFAGILYWWIRRLVE